MGDERRRILELLAQGRISVDEAERLLRALASGTPEMPADTGPVPQYLVMVGRDSGKGDGSKDVFRMKVPLSLLRAGIKMKALVPEEAREGIQARLRAKGIGIDPFDISEDEVDDFLRALTDLEMFAGDDGGEFRMYVA